LWLQWNSSLRLCVERAQLRSCPPPNKPSREPEIIMPDNALNPALKEASKASSNAGAALDHAERSFGEATSAARGHLGEAAAAAKANLADAAKRIEASLTQGLETLRAQTRTYTDTAGQSVDEASRYVSERVRERPITATLAGLGVGVLLGLLLAGNRGGRDK
jgi:ElaB/YqjD/DUF883 family membrane-anchored ribosome-binding protein